jgi:PAN domain
MSGKAAKAEQCSATAVSKPLKVDAATGRATYPTLRLTCEKPLRFEYNTNRPGGDLRNGTASDAVQCSYSCVDEQRCRAFTWVRPGIQGPQAQCWLKSTVPSPVRNACCTSGVM